MKIDLKILENEATNMQTRITDTEAEIVELEAQQKVRLEEMAFYALLDEIYAQMNTLHAARNTSYTKLDDLYELFY